MPVYEYQCESCGVVERVLPMAASQAHCQCPRCGLAVRRIIGSAPHLSAMGRRSVQAAQVNERSQHDPVRGAGIEALTELENRQAGSSGGRHPANCGCCRGTTAGTVTHADRSKSFPDKRPWMISH